MALIAFDGTGNEDKPGEDKDTNVLRFFRAYAKLTDMVDPARDDWSPAIPRSLTSKASDGRRTRLSATRWPRPSGSAVTAASARRWTGWNTTSRPATPSST